MAKKRILITGAMGFVGSHCVEEVLKSTDWDIVILDRLDISGNPNRLLNMECWEKEKHRVKFVWWDLKSAINSQASKEIGEVDYIWHLAASSHVDRSIEDPLSFIMDNVVGTTNLLNYARTIKDKLKLFINFSTDEVFGSVDEGFSKEFDHHHCKNPYSASKSGQEAIGEAFENCYKVPVITTHTMNVFGERQHPEKFIPLCVRKILNDETITIHSNPEKTKAAIRSYVHARNIAKVLLFLTKRGFKGYDEWNITGEKEMDALQIAQFVGKVIGKEIKYEMVNWHESRPGHDLRYALSGEKLKSLRFFYPLGFEESLEKVVKWYLRSENKIWL